MLVMTVHLVSMVCPERREIEDYKESQEKDQEDDPDLLVVRVNPDKPVFPEVREDLDHLDERVNLAHKVLMDYRDDLDHQDHEVNLSRATKDSPDNLDLLDTQAKMERPAHEVNVVSMVNVERMVSQVNLEWKDYLVLMDVKENPVQLDSWVLPVFLVIKVNVDLQV